MTDAATKNTDTILWATNMDDLGYADILFLTKGGGIGMNVGGFVIVKSLKAWHQLGIAAESFTSKLYVGLPDGESADKENTK